MASNPPLLTSSFPTTIAPASVTIAHVQLRDLIVCPRERGVVNYIQHHSIVEHNIRSSDVPPRTLADLTFKPNSIASLEISNSGHTILAAGGPEAEMHLSLQTPESPDKDDQEGTNRGTIWQFETVLPGSINNSVLLTSMCLTNSNESSVEPRVVVSNNDCTVRFYDIPIRGEQHPKSIKESGTLRLPVAMNHSSLSPDGCTLLSVGDSPKVYLHRLSGGARISFTPITTLYLPPPCAFPLHFGSSFSPASFSTAFSANGSKFAVASQEGAVVVWDVRSSRPLKAFHTDKTRSWNGKPGGGSATGWLNDEFWDWSRGGSKAPGWGVRSVKFGSGGERGYSGKEIMTFTEHTSLIHVIDARTFETEEIVSMPTCFGHTQPLVRPPRFRSPRHITATERSRFQRPTPPPVVLALQETFRISASDSSSSTSSASTSSRPSSTQTRWTTRGRRSRSRDPEDDLVVIPPLGDRTVEDDVQRLLELHGLRARRREEHADEDGNGNSRGEDDMEVDELESDCVSSHTPSRSSSPSPSTHLAAQPLPARLTSGNPNFVRMPSPLARRRTWTQDDFPARLTGAIEEEEDGDVDVNVDFTNTDVDLAGTCFDPSGGYVYAASVKGIAEWSVSGSEKRWWVDGEWM